MVGYGRTKLLGWLHSLSFRNRIRTAFMCLLIFAVATTGGVSYYIVSNVMEKQALKQSQDSLNKSAMVVDERLRKILVYIMTITISQPFKEMMSDNVERNSGYYYKHLSALQPIFEQYILNERSINSILISTSIGDFYSTTKRRLFEHPFQETKLYRQMISSSVNQRMYWSAEHKDELFSDGKNVISLVFEPFPQNKTKDTFIIVNVDAAKIHELFDDPNHETDLASFIIAGDKSSVFSNRSSTFDPALFHQLVDRIGTSPEDSFVFPYEGEEYLINSAKIQLYPDWTLLAVQPKSELLRLIQGIRWSSFIIVIIGALLTVYITNLLTGVLFRPLIQMQYVMNKVSQHNLHLRYKSKYKDELSQMGEKFNQMLDEINLLMDRNSNMEREKHIAEIKALQAQINPHFLYNSLNMIFLKCMDQQYDKAKEMVVSLSKLFELGLNKGAEGTTVAFELNHVEYYMKIQQACYRNLFEYRIHVEDESLLALPVLNIMFQPLVENSILHGFKDRSAGGIIRIYVSREGNLLCLGVEDNGRGMDPWRVYRSIKDGGPECYALRNIYNRLKLYGGEQAQLLLTSTPGVKTEVQLRIPVHSIGGTSVER